MVLTLYVAITMLTIRYLFGKNTCRFSTVAATSTLPKEELIAIGKHKVNYIKVGTGSHNVLCMPGALGTIWTDFKPQVEGLNKDKFTIVAWDPPGYGKSQPPLKDFPSDFFEKDATVAVEFMKALNISKFSILGWSDGGITGMILAAKYPSVVNKLAVWGANSFILAKELEQYQKIKDTNSWSPKMRQPMIDVYGEVVFASLWANWVEGMQNLYKERNGNICKEMLKDIKCQTLILHGEKDPMVENVHVSHLHTNIDNSRIHLYPDGKHNIHLRYAEDFNKRVQDFLLS